MRRHLLIPLLAVLLPGCIVPIPHMSRRSPTADGRVLDAATGKPLAGASVQLSAYDNGWVLGGPRISGIDGRFHIPATYNLHACYLLALSSPLSAPEGDFWRGSVVAKREGYRTLVLKRGDNSEPRVDLGDLRMSHLKGGNTTAIKTRKP